MRNEKGKSVRRARSKHKRRDLDKKRFETAGYTSVYDKVTVYDEAEASDDGVYAEIIEEIQKEKLSGDTVQQKPAPKKPKKKKKSAGKVIAAIVVMLILFIVIAMGTNLFDDNDILAPLEDGKINILLLGVDEEGLRTDAIMVASYNVNEGAVNLLSVPRDTKIYLTNKKATKKINSVHALSSEERGKILGVQATAEAVTQLTGIPINYYVEFSFLSIDHLFDSLGTVLYDVPDIEGKGRGMNYDDPYQNLHIHLKPGMQELTGEQVQQFLRYRKSNYRVGTGSDSDRVKRQHEFIKAVVDQKMNIALITKIPGIYSQLSKEIRTNISSGDVAKYIRYLNKISSENVKSFSLPGEDKMIGGASYFVCDMEAAKLLLSENFGVDGEITDKITLSGKNPQKPIVAGNMTKPASAPKNDAAETQKQPETPAKGEKKEESKAETKPSEPQKEEKTEQKEEKPQTPPVEPNKTPLEEIYNLDD